MMNANLFSEDRKESISLSYAKMLETSHVVFGNLTVVFAIYFTLLEGAKFKKTFTSVSFFQLLFHILVIVNA